MLLLLFLSWTRSLTGKMPVDRGKEILGTFSPQLEPYNHVCLKRPLLLACLLVDHILQELSFLMMITSATTEPVCCCILQVFEETRNETMAQELGNGHTMAQEVAMAFLFSKKKKMNEQRHPSVLQKLHGQSPRHTKTTNSNNRINKH